MAKKKSAAGDWSEPVHVGSDEHLDDPNGNISVIRSEDGRLAFMPQSVGRLRGEASNLVAEVQGVVRDLQTGQEYLDELIVRMRELGVSWSAIGWCVGFTAQGAQQRWGSHGQP